MVYLLKMVDLSMAMLYYQRVNASKCFNAFMPFLLLPQPTSRSNSLRTAVPSVHICEPTSRDICVCLSQGPGMGLEPIPHLYEIWPLKPWLCILHGDVLALAILGVPSGILCTTWLFNIAIGTSPFLIGKLYHGKLLNTQRVLPSGKLT